MNVAFVKNFEHLSANDFVDFINDNINFNHETETHFWGVDEDTIITPEHLERFNQDEHSIAHYLTLLYDIFGNDYDF